MRLIAQAKKNGILKLLHTALRPQRRAEVAWHLFGSW